MWNALFCERCGNPMRREGAHDKCDRCGWLTHCCEGDIAASVSTNVSHRAVTDNHASGSVEPDSSTSTAQKLVTKDFPPTAGASRRATKASAKRLAKRQRSRKKAS